MTSVKGLLIEVNTPPLVVSIDANDSLATLQKLVGGFIEGISGSDWATWHAYCNEEGKIHGLPPNWLATNLAHKLGWPEGDILCGSVVILGGGDEGEEADVPTSVIELARELNS